MKQRLDEDQRGHSGDCLLFAFSPSLIFFYSDQYFPCLFVFFCVSLGELSMCRLSFVSITHSLTGSLSLFVGFIDFMTHPPTGTLSSVKNYSKTTQKKPQQQ